MIEIVCCLCEEFGVGALSALGGLVQKENTGAQGEGNVLRLARCVGRGWRALGGDPLSQVGAPGAEVIDPCLDGVEPVAELVHGEGGRPKVVGEWLYRRGAPGG